MVPPKMYIKKGSHTNRAADSKDVTELYYSPRGLEEKKKKIQTCRLAIVKTRQAGRQAMSDSHSSAAALSETRIDVPPPPSPWLLLIGSHGCVALS